MSDNRTPEELRRLADEQVQNAVDSWERSDTDGYLSQLVAQLNAEKYRIEADLLEKGNRHEFDALFDLDGNIVNARIVNTKYGVRWMLFNNDETPTGEFLPLKPARRDTLRKRGYTEGVVIRNARVVFSKGELGSTRPIIVAVGKPTDVIEVVYTDRFSDD